MAIHGWGSPIWMSEIAAEFGGAAPHYISEYYRNGGLVTPNNLGIPTSGPIWLSQFYGAAKSVAGAWDQGAPGTYAITVPVYSTLRVRVWGGGGGGHPCSGPAGYGNPGGASQFHSVWAGGGQGGGFAVDGVGASYAAYPGGVGGGASGGGYNQGGAQGEYGPYYAGGGLRGGNGGAGAQGGGGGAGGGQGWGYGANGAWPGGGGGSAGGNEGPIYTPWGSVGYYRAAGGGGGGGGGYADRTFTAGEPGAPVPGTVINAIVGAGGGRMGGTYDASYAGQFYTEGGAGASGRVRLDWT